MVKQTVTVTLSGRLGKVPGKKAQGGQGALFSNSMKRALGVTAGGSTQGKKLPPGDLRTKLGSAKAQPKTKVTFQNEEGGGGLARHAGAVAGAARAVAGAARGRRVNAAARAAQSADDDGQWTHDMYFASGQDTLESSTAPPQSYLVSDAERRRRGGAGGRQAAPSRALYKAGLLSSAGGGGGVRVSAKGGAAAVVKKKGRGTFTFQG